MKSERLKFDQLERNPGVWIHAVGEYTENDVPKRAAVYIGQITAPSSDMIKEAAKEAVKGLGFDLLIICGLAFDPFAADETTQYGKLKILNARMNPDLTLGNEFLKKTGAGNLFMVFGEPDIEIKKQKDGKMWQPYAG